VSDPHNVSRETLACLNLDLPDGFYEDVRIFESILIEKNQVMNLVGPATLPQFWQRHILDSLQLLTYVDKPLIWADLGAGAGFPGLVLAIGFKWLKAYEGSQIYLIDSLGKRCRFLDEVAQKLNLNTRIYNGRVETFNQKVDRVTARAFAPLPRLLDCACGLLAKPAQGLILKGERLDSEILEAQKSWRLDYEITPSISDPRGRILHIKGAHRGSKF